MVPNGWSNTCIDDNITFSGGAQPPREVFKFEPEEGYIRLIQIRDYKSDKFITYVPKKLAKKFCTADDVMIGRYGPPIFQILRGIEGAYNVALIKAIPKSGVDKEFMYYFLKRDPLLKVIESFSQRTSGQTGIEMDVLKAYPMHLPPLPEQRKIAQILSTWDRAIATTEKLIDASKQQKKALMQQLLTGKKRLVNPETGKAFEGEWERHSLSDLVYVDRKSLGKKTPDNFKFKYISLSNVDFGMISKELEVHEFSTAPSRARRVLQDGDILMSTVRPNLKGFAKVTSCYADCIASTGFAVLTPKKKVSGDYIYQYIFSAHVTGQIDSLVVGSNYPAINSSDVSGLKVYCPAFEEQQKIASVLTAADKEIEFLEAKLVHLKEEKKALMQQLLTGKRRVKVSETEAA